jgi:signal peptidase
MLQTEAQEAEKKAYKSISRRILNILSNVLFVLILLAALIVSVVAIQSKATGTTPSIGDYQLLKVISGSMEPAIHTGSVVVIKEIDPKQLKVGDIVTFMSVEYDDQLVTHRISKIEQTAINGLIFTTRGDANDSEDFAPLLASQVRGRAVFTIPLLGYLMNFIQSREGLLLLIIVPCLFLAAYEIKRMRKSALDLKKQMAEEVRDAPKK